MGKKTCQSVKPKISHRNSTQLFIGTMGGFCLDTGLVAYHDCYVRCEVSGCNRLFYGNRETSRKGKKKTATGFKSNVVAVVGRLAVLSFPHELRLLSAQ